LARVRRYLGATLVGGAMFLVVKSIEYTHEIEHGFTLSSNLFWSFYYFMTGLHAGHVIAGMIAIAVVRHQAGRASKCSAWSTWDCIGTSWISSGSSSSLSSTWPSKVIQESTYIRVWLWLLALLGASLVVGLLGAPHIAVAMIFAVAAIKALLVLGNFMHLRWEPKLVWAIVGFAASA